MLVSSAINKTDVRIEGGAGPYGGSFSLLHGDVTGSITPIAEGAHIGIYLMPRNGEKFSFVPKPTDAPVSFEATVDVGDIWSAGVDVNYNPGGTLEFTPKVGLGIGARHTYTPSVNFSNKKSEANGQGNQGNTRSIPVVEVTGRIESDRLKRER